MIFTFVARKIDIFTYCFKVVQCEYEKLCNMTIHLYVLLFYVLLVMHFAIKELQHINTKMVLTLKPLIVQ